MDNKEPDMPPNPDCPFICEYQGDVILADPLVGKMLKLPTNKCKDWYLQRCIEDGGAISYVLDSKSGAEGVKPKYVHKLLMKSSRVLDLPLLGGQSVSKGAASAV